MENIIIDKSGTATNKTILDLYNDMADGKLILHPSFQRNLVWNDNHKESFIETILNKYPFPEVYFANGDIDPENLTHTTVVVDGQQRLNAIYMYIKGDESLTYRRIKRYAELDDTEKRSFLNYKVVVRDLGSLSDKDIKEVFKRINSVGYALNAIEVDHALYDGEYISVAQEIANERSVADLGIFNETAISRMRDVEFVLQVMTAVEAGGFSGSNAEMEKYIVQYDNYYNNKDLMKASFLKSATYLNSLGLKKDSIWKNKSCTYSLLVNLMRREFNEESLMMPEKNAYLLRLNDGEKKIRQAHTNGENNKYSEFYDFVYQNTSSKKARDIRDNMINNLTDNLFMID